MEVAELAGADTEGGFRGGCPPRGRSLPAKPKGTLQAWDPVRRERVWEVPFDIAWNPGTLTTAGDLVFQGTVEGDLVAYHAATGEVLWRQPVGLGVVAPPITYAIDGRQYLALLVGWGSGPSGGGTDELHGLGWAYGVHPRRVLAFSLEGETEMPASPPPAPPVPLEDPAFEIDEALADYGLEVYANCFMCHGADGISGGAAPDLRASPIVLADGAFEDVVREGTLLENGMPSYPALSDAHLEALRHYIRQRARAGLGLIDVPATGITGQR